MSVKNEQKVNETVTNAAFVSKTTDSSMVSRLNLTRGASGDPVNDVQQTINDIKSNAFSFSGIKTFLNDVVFSTSSLFTELLSDPSTPENGKRTLFAKSDGFYEVASSGAVRKIGSGSGSGGHSPAWSPTWENGGILDTENQNEVVLLDLDKSAFFDMKVSALYGIGTHKKISIGVYSPTNSAKYNLELTIYLYDIDNNILVPNVTVVEEVESTNSSINQYKVLEFDVTDASGDFNGEFLEPNDILRFEIKRIAASSDEETEQVRLLVKGAEVYDV